MPKKSNTRRSDGRIAVQVYLGMVNGKRKYRTVYGKTQKEANQKAEELKTSMNKGIDIIAQKETFSAWAERWFNIKKHDIGHAQQEAYRGYLTHIYRYVGDMPLKDIKLADLQFCITELAEKNPTTGKPTAKRTLNGIKQTISQVFRFCIENEIIEKNLAEFIKVPKNAPAESRRAITEDERQWILNTEHKMKTAAMIMLYAGLRRGEVLALNWTDIDLTNGTINVNKAIEFIDNKATLKTPKTAAGIRTVYMPNILTEYLKKQSKDNILVCPSLNGELFTKSSFHKAWESYLNALDINSGNYLNRTSKFDPRYHGRIIDNITPHMLRHTFCTDMIKNGVNIKTAQQQMGHEKVETTLNIYAHFFSNENNSQEMQKMNASSAAQEKTS